MTPMSSPLDGNGMAAAEAAFNASINNPQMVPCSKCEGRGFHHGFGEDGNDPDWCTECGGSQFNVVPGEETRAIEAAIAAYLASAAPSQTAVEPVAGELEILLQWLPKLIAVLGSKPEHVDDVARLARMHALIPEQTAAREAAEKERDEAQGFVERLQAALFFWMPGVRPETDTGLARSAGDDAYLLSGYSGPELGPCWGDDILATVATLKARVAELEVDDDGQPSEQQEWRDYDADC